MPQYLYKGGCCRKGFSLVELLATILILAVLAAVAVPLYMNTHKTSAARACKGNIKDIAAIEAVYAFRHGSYATIATLVGNSPEGLSGVAKCPLDGSVYLLTDQAGGTGTAIITGSTSLFYITCTNATTHLTTLGTGSHLADWERPMPTVVSEDTP